MDCVLAFWGFEYGHLLQLFDPRLSFRGFGGIVAEFVDECLQMGTLGHLVFVLAFGRLAALLFGCVEGVEVGAFIIVEAFRMLVDYVGCYFVQKGSVVGNDEEGTGVGLEVAGEEGDGGDVQHIGRFCDVSACILGIYQELFYRRGGAGLARRRALWPMPISSSNLRRRFWWHSAAFLLKSLDLPVCLQLETQLCPTPSQKVLGECR